MAGTSSSLRVLIRAADAWLAHWVARMLAHLALPCRVTTSDDADRDLVIVAVPSRELIATLSHSANKPDRAPMIAVLPSGSRSLARRVARSGAAYYRLDQPLWVLRSRIEELCGPPS
ncbi:MAG: hypothetical protein MUC69_00975 [Gemmatimonadales bacterium]|nr:hypothetical protein [Gemmatimonadales bacterium]